jgi:hypothetical protein
LSAKGNERKTDSHKRKYVEYHRWRRILACSRHPKEDNSAENYACHFERQSPASQVSFLIFLLPFQRRNFGFD